MKYVSNKSLGRGRIEPERGGARPPLPGPSGRRPPLGPPLRQLALFIKSAVRPKENKGKRDELSENLMKMMEESNRFRSHQAREILIEVLELRLKKKKDALNLLKTHVSNTESLL